MMRTADGLYWPNDGSRPFRICYACGRAIFGDWTAWQERDGRVRHGHC